MVCSFLGSRVVVVGFLILVSFLFILFITGGFLRGGLELILITVCLGLLVDKLFGFSCYYLCMNSQSILRNFYTLEEFNPQVRFEFFTGIAQRR